MRSTTYRVSGSGRERPVNVGEYVRGIVGHRRIVGSRRADDRYPDSRAGYQRHDATGMAEVVRPVGAGLAPPTSGAGGYVLTGQARRSHRTGQSRIQCDQVSGLGLVLEGLEVGRDSQSALPARTGDLSIGGSPLAGYCGTEAALERRTLIYYCTLLADAGSPDAAIRVAYFVENNGIETPSPIVKPFVARR